MNPIIQINLPQVHVMPQGLEHSVQTYWMNIAFVMTNVMNDMHNDLNAVHLMNLNNAIEIAHNCAHLYGLARRQEIEFTVYVNTVNTFYIQLSDLLNSNNQLHNHLENAVRAEVELGTRYFHEFLDTLNVQVY
jgi:hypothetical protein